MRFVVPALVEDALWAAARRRLPDDVMGGPALTAAVVDRSRRYTSERDRLAEPGGGRAADADLAARALFFTVADAAKLHVPLAELTGPLPAPPGFLAGASLRVVDVGAGCGAVSLGLLTFLAGPERRGPRPRVELTLVDRDRDALAIAADALAEVAAGLGLTATVTARVGDAAEPLPGGADLVLAGSLLNELDAPEAAADALLAALAPAGVAVVIEPALRDTTRALHALRDRAVAEGRAAVLAPCTRRAAPCPALADARDWCHDHRPLELPPRAHQLARVTGLRDGDLKLAYLALCRPGAAPPAPPAWRVVADPHASKGKHELLLCGAPGWVPVRLLRRHRSAANRAAERARRGDLLAIEPAPGADRHDLDAASAVTALAGD